MAASVRTQFVELSGTAQCAEYRKFVCRRGMHVCGFWFMVIKMAILVCHGGVRGLCCITVALSRRCGIDRVPMTHSCI